ncbi:mycofactocin dehydrogenase MftG [Streptomyces beihaiensis]|uniref:Mycofactocin system GMC family oxidoreductase MftG n=1 Tax=Streptomyces beihaiensis TaxID=2984495 RepID=A0ABT3TSY7_9ACTN|nr:mycofactocin system GMC family oxidoreductase MftG [Streptomyces beihaiensis]MCX3060159.1 mycofactocin system GMC family oxidoreductase MftG [Streptomyces beihaiensis]
MVHYTDIVVGAGSSGAVIAARLSEDPTSQVLLIEAGPDYPTTQSLPADVRDGRYPSMSGHDWGYQAEAVPGREIPLVRGKVVGGTSAINTCLAVRPDPLDFEDWMSRGIDGWSWDDVLPYLIRIEDDQDYGPPLHGKGGPTPVRRWRDEELSPLQKAFLQTSRDLGFPEVPDHNAPGAVGVGPMAQNLVDGMRISTAVAYLASARKREQLEIRADTLAERIVFEDGRAVGVRIVTDGVSETVYGDRITVCTGAVGTPALLMRSGIGAADALERLGVPVVADLPGVGENLLDHPTCWVTRKPRPGVYDESLPVTQVLLQYTAPGSEQARDMQLYLFSHIDLNGYAPAVQEKIGTDKVFMVSAGVERPYSVGRIVVESTDPQAAPRIEFNFLSHEEDRRRLREGMRLADRIARSEKFELFASGETVPGPEVIADDDALDAFMLSTVGTHFHPVGTAKMGPASDPLAVVDSRCRVHGVPGLRVADASVMPVMVRANTNLTCLMIGERVGDWLMEEGRK